MSSPVLRFGLVLVLLVLCPLVSAQVVSSGKSGNGGLGEVLAVMIGVALAPVILVIASPFILVYGLMSLCKKLRNEAESLPNTYRVDTTYVYNGTTFSRPATLTFSPITLKLGGKGEDADFSGKLHPWTWSGHVENDGQRLVLEKHHSSSSNANIAIVYNMPNSLWQMNGSSGEKSSSGQWRTTDPALIGGSASIAFTAPINNGF